MRSHVLVVVAVVAGACSSTAAEPTTTLPPPTVATVTTTAQAPTTSTPTTALPNDPIAAGILPLTNDGELDIAALAAFVERHRGATYSSPPEVRFVTSASGAGAPPSPISQLDALLLALLGIVDPDFDADFNPFASGEPSGWCCPVSVIPADDPLVTASIVVHELTHRLDIELADAPPPIAGGLDSGYLAGIIEGNATRVEEAFLANFGTTIEESRAANGLRQELPPLVDAAIAFPYTHGRFLTEAIAAEGGEDAVTAALTSPPQSAEQVMFPDAYLAGELPAEVTVTATSEGTLVRFGTIGPHLLSLALSETLPEHARLELLRGWAGDDYDIRRSDEESCLFAAVLMDDAGAADRLAAALSRAVPHMAVTVDGPRLDTESCLPV